VRGQRGELLLPERGAGEAPAALGRFGKQHPGAARLRRVAGDLRDDPGDLGDELPLPARWSTPGGASTCARTVRAAPAAAVFTALGGIRWMYAPVLFKCVAPGFSTPSAFSNARVSSSAI